MRCAPVFARRVCLPPPVEHHTAHLALTQHHQTERALLPRRFLLYADAAALARSVEHALQPEETKARPNLTQPPLCFSPIARAATLLREARRARSRPASASSLRRATSHVDRGAQTLQGPRAGAAAALTRPLPRLSAEARGSLPLQRRPHACPAATLSVLVQPLRQPTPSASRLHAS
eukprot:6172908-Pleurochrysis_carterae.AAC.1